MKRLVLASLLGAPLVLSTCAAQAADNGRDRLKDLGCQTLNGISGVERSSYEYAWLVADHPLTARAFLGADIKPSGLWARRYRFTLHGAPLLVQELFFPAIGQV